MSINTKNHLRTQMKQLRKAVHKDHHQTAALAIIDIFNTNFSLQAPTIISGYNTINSEFDVSPLMEHLHKLGHICCLPITSPADRMLHFKTWAPDTALAKGQFDIAEPSAANAAVTPAVLLIPLLAFDNNGYRLGYGKGHYDTTLSDLKKTGNITTIGIGYEAQRVDRVPTEPHDQALNWILTEQKAYRIT
jgi:5-formyltetrahydrofolate cyclo-ligase